MTNIFIPTKLRVGFQQRKDTYSGKLAYVTYYDLRGRLCKEKSWEGWRHKDIEPLELSNDPVDGFTINKDIARYSGEWFSSTRTMIRIHDSRGFEFEITTENLIGVLMHTDCLKRGLEGKFVYAFCSGALILLPVNSEEYQSATKFTSNLSRNVKAKELILGATYACKRTDPVVYLGKFPYRGYVLRYSGEVIPQLPQYVFWDPADGEVVAKTKLDFLASCISPDPIPNYAEVVDKLVNTLNVGTIVSSEVTPRSIDWDNIEEWTGTSFWVCKDHLVVPASVYTCSYNPHTRKQEKTARVARSQSYFNLRENTFSRDSTLRYADYYDYRPISDVCTAFQPVDLYVTLNTGKKIKIDVEKLHRPLNLK